jgi:hypothetical protein
MSASPKSASGLGDAFRRQICRGYSVHSAARVFGRGLRFSSQALLAMTGEALRIWPSLNPERVERGGDVGGRFDMNGQKSPCPGAFDILGESSKNTMREAGTPIALTT